MQRALASGAIISNLFPEKVRKQLYEEEQQKLNDEKAEKDFAFSSAGHSSIIDDSSTMGDTKRTRQIAEQYENTSKYRAREDNLPLTAFSSTHRTAFLRDCLGLLIAIFFADLVGFTAWSAKRTPVEVFDLLEAVYGQFDKAAARRKVFKIETVR